MKTQLYNALSTLTLACTLGFYSININAQNYELVNSEILKPWIVQISPDGSRVVFQDSNTFGLHSVPITGGNIVKLNPNINVSNNFELSEDGTHAVYTAAHDSDSYELYSVPITGGAAIKLNHGLDSDENIYYFKISADGDQVVFSVVRDTNIVELYSVPITGGVVTRLNLDAETTCFTGFCFDISADSNYVVYIAGQSSDNSHELYSVPITGPTAASPIIRLNPKFVSGRDVYSFTINADSSHVIYNADQDINNIIELYSAPITGPTTTNPIIKLNPNLVSNGNVLEPEISKDGSRVIYRADQDTDGTFELYSVPATGITANNHAIKLNPPLVSGGNVSFGYKISPDNKYVIYFADQDRDNILELYSVPINGGTAVKLNPRLTTGNPVDIHFEISPDSRHVFFQARKETNNANNIYKAPIAGGPTTKLNPDVVSDGSFPFGFGFDISKDGSRMTYIDEHLFARPLSTCPAVESNSLCKENTDGISDWETEARPTLQQTVTFSETDATVAGAIIDLRGLSHTFRGNISLELISPNGTKMTVLSSDANLSANFGGAYRFIDGGASLTEAESSLGLSGIIPPGSYEASSRNQTVSFTDTFKEVQVQGTWTLRLTDNFQGNTGVLSSWRLTLLTQSELKQNDLCIPIKSKSNNIALVCL